MSLSASANIESLILLIFCFMLFKRMHEDCKIENQI